MKTSRRRARLKSKVRRLTAGLICMCTMIYMMNIVLPVSAYNLETFDKEKTVMEYIVRAWRSDGNSVEKPGCIYPIEGGGFKCEGELKPVEDKGDTIIIQPGNFGINDEEFQGFSISAGQDAASIDENGNLVIKYTPNVHIVKAHAFFKSAGLQVAGSNDAKVYGGGVR